MKNPSRTELWTAFGSYDVLQPDFSHISILDVAWHLAQANRYNGACARPYSVAQHCLLVAQVLPAEYKFAGLMHDVAETVLGDIVSPFKSVLTEYQMLEEVCIRQAERHFGLSEGILDDPLVHQADRQVMAAEMTSDLLSWEELHLPPRAPVIFESQPWTWSRDMFAACFALSLSPDDMSSSGNPLEKHSGDFFQKCLHIFALYEQGVLTREEACSCGRAINALMRGEETDILTGLFSQKRADDCKIAMRAVSFLRQAKNIMTTPCLLREERKDFLSFSSC